MERDMAATQVEKDAVRRKVRERYAGIAEAVPASGCCGGASSSLGDAEASRKLGYSEEALAAVPEGSNMGLGCGNPEAIAQLKLGEVVVDLGAGGGFDCFLASARVGSAGRVIGVDMTPSMISLARDNAAKHGYENVEFRLGEIEHLPVADSIADALISNCVINLSPDKPQVYREAFRVLRPGGRIAVSDVVAVADIPSEVKADLAAHAGCVAGAETVEVVRVMLVDAGFREINITPHESSRAFIKDWVPGSGAENFILSATITAKK